MRKIAAAALLAVAGASGAAWWLAPYSAMRDLRAAAEAGDTDRMAELMDSARVADSIRTQMLARVAAPETVGAAVGNLLAAAVTERAVSSLVTPQSLRALISRGAPARPGEAKPRADWAVDRVSMSTVIAYPEDQRDISPQARDRFVFKRSGLASWRLSEIRLSGS